MSDYTDLLERIAELEEQLASCDPPRRAYRTKGRRNPRHDEWAQRWLAGEEQNSIAASSGVTTSAVHSALHATLPKSIHRLARRREQSRRRLRAIVNSNTHWCVVCGGQILRGAGRSRTCSADHQHMRLLLLHHVTPGRKEAHKLAVLKVNAARGANQYLKRYSAEVLAGVRDPEPRFSGDGWLLEGSKAWDAAVLAHKNGWPIFDALPERIRQQVAGTLPVKGETRECLWCGKEFWTDYDQKTCSNECRLARFPSLRWQKTS